MSKVQICNRALSKYLGVGRINSLDEDTPAAEQCNLHYDDTLETLLELHPWYFAQGRQVLAELANDRVGEWTHKYTRPADALFIQWVNEPQSARLLISQDRDPDTDRESFGEFIYSNVPDAVCVYTQLITDTTKYPMYFRNAMSAMLAASMAMALTEDLRRAANAQDQALNELDIAMTRDEQEKRLTKVGTVPEYLSLRGIE